MQHFLDKDEFRLYQLIWNRFVASQMNPAVYDATAVDVVAIDKAKHEQRFRATGSVIKFPGFTAVYTEGQKTRRGAAQPRTTSARSSFRRIKEGDAVSNKALNPTQHFTQPPPRFTDASLIRELEEKGIGRPSTYASILSNLQDREYVEKRDGGRYFPSELGTVVTELLVQRVPGHPELPSSPPAWKTSSTKSKKAKPTGRRR